MNKKFYRYKRFWLLLLTAAYLLIGIFYLPKVIQQQIKLQLSEQFNMQAGMSEVRFNPLTFSTTINDLSLTDENQQNWYNSESTLINFDPINLIWGEWKFSDLQLTKPNITVLTNQAGQVVIPAIPSLEPSEDTGTAIDLVIDDIRLEQGTLQFKADNIKENFSLNFKRVEIQHEKLSLKDEDTQFDITLTTESDEVLTLNGHYNHHQQKVYSQLQFNGWQASTLNKFIPDDLMLISEAGVIHAKGDMDWLLKTKPKFKLSTVEIIDLNCSWQNEVHTENFHASFSTAIIDTETQSISIDAIQSNQADWQLNWPLTIPENSTDSDQASPTSSPAWQVSIKEVQIENWPLLFIDNAINAELPVSVDALSLTNTNNQAQPFALTSQITLPQGGQVTVNSEQSIEPLILTSNWVVTDLTMPQLTPWINDQSGLVFTQGTLNTQQTVEIKDHNFNITGELSLTAANIENKDSQNIAEVAQLVIGNTAISSQDKTIIVDQINLDQAKGNIIIDADKNINIQNLTTDETATETSQDTGPSDWIIKVGAINIKDTSTALIDQSIEPSVTTSISELNGAIKGLSSENLSKADVKITGKFNQFSPLSIEGQINPLSSEAYTDIKVLVEDLDLLAYSPYAATYLAFPINGGKLNLELEYSLNKNELRGKNNMLFKQFKLGNRTQSPDAVNLPLKLAVSLLRDMNGEMKIDLPVSGNINDPEFSYGGLVGKAFFKLITSIVASPFKILGALIPNPDPNLSEIQFTAGQAELLASEQNKLNQIAEILQKKPKLNLQLNPHIGAGFDRLALQSEQLLKQAPFSQLDFTDTATTQWISAQVTAEQLNQHASDSGTDFNLLWQTLAAEQTISQEVIDALVNQRNLNIKNYLIETAGIAAEKIFVEQTQTTDENQALIKIGVSR